MLKDLKQTSKHTGIYAIGNVVTKLIGLILIPLYTNASYLSHDDYGALAVLEATSQLLVGVLTMAMVAGLSRWYWDKQYINKQKSIFYSTLIFLLLCIIPVSIALISFSETFSSILFNSVNYSYLLRLTIAAAGFQIINNQALALARLKSKSTMFIVAQIFKITFSLGLILWGILLKGKGLVAIWEATLIGEICTLFVLLPFIIKNIQLRIQLKVLREMISYGLPLMLASVSGVLLATADRYMLSSMSSLENTGIYSLGFRIANTLKVVVTASVTNAILPLQMKKIDMPDNQRFFSKINTYTSFVFVVALLGLSLFALEGLKLFTGANIYWQANGLVPIISYALLFGLMLTNIRIGLIIKKKTKIIGVLIFITSIINIWLNLVLIPLFDIYGAAFATLFSQLLFFVATTIASQKQYYIPYEWRKLALMIGLSIIIVLIGLSISEIQIWFRILIKLSLFLAFPFTLYLFGFYDKVEIDTIKSLFNTWKSPSKFKENIKRILN